MLKKRPWHSCFPVKFAKVLKTPFILEHLRWLLLPGERSMQRNVPQAYNFIKMRDHIFIFLLKYRFFYGKDVKFQIKKFDRW